MGNNRVQLAKTSVKNGKKAYFAMCRVSLLLLFFAFSSRFLSDAAMSFIYDNNTYLSNLFVRTAAVFGVERQVSYVAAKMLFTSEAFYEILSMVISFVSLVLPAIIFEKCTRLRDAKCFNIKGEIVKWFIPMFFLCQLFTMLASVFSETLYSFLVPEWAVSMDAATGVVASEFNGYEFVVRVLCTCILVPVIEEYVFRGVIFSYLKEYGLAFGVISSAVIFGLAHSAPVQSVYAFSFGLVSAFLVVICGNLKSSIMFHALNNFITIGSGYLMGTVNESVFSLINAVFIMTVSALGFVGMYKVFNDGGYMDTFREKANENDGGLVNKPGMFQVMAFPVALYTVFYILDIVSRVL